MILREHGMGRVGGSVVFKDNVLLVLAALDNLIGTGAELVLDLVDDRDDEGGNDGEDKNRELLFELLENLWQDGNLVNGLGDALNNFIMELDGGHDLLEDALDVLRVLLGLTWRNLHLLHLSGASVVLDVVHLLLLVVASKETIGDFVKEVSEDAGVLVLALLECALELLNLVLSQLIGHWCPVSDANAM